MNITKELRVMAMFLLIIAASAMNCAAEGFKSAEQIMEYAAKLDNQGEKERAIKIYQVIVDKYPDTKQAKMAKSRMGVLQARIVEEKESAERSRQAEESRRASERSSANEGHNNMCHSLLETCQAGCVSSSDQSRCNSHCWSAYQDCKR